MSRVNDALLLRDLVQAIVDDKLGKERPKSSYALVTGYNLEDGTVSVIFDGDDITVDIPAGSIYPSEIGQTVRVGGPAGSKVIEDVMGENLTEVKAREAQETADGKNTVNYGDEPPEGTDHKDGDIWFDEGNSNMPNVWRDGQWVTIEDLRVAAIKEAQDELKQDLDTVVENGLGSKTFYKPTQPTAAESKEGDLWFDTSADGNNELHTYVNGQWVSAADARIAAIQQAQAELAQDLNDVVENGLGTKTHYSPTQPTVASSREGDLWFNTSTGGNKELHVFTNGSWVSAADARIAAVQSAQAEIEGDVSVAQQRADEAYQNAATADSKAVTAKNAADAAASAASDAAGIANGKGKVLIQSTAPGVADRNNLTLWIDTTGGANTPKRWSTGSTWVAVTDKAATDAASAAASAATAAANAKTAADNAQTTATNAQNAASAAQGTASSALTAANTKNRVTRSISAPTTPYEGRVDDTWFVMSALGENGRVLSQWKWNGTTWIQELIGGEVVAYLDAAKITTGYLSADRIAANSLNAGLVLVAGSAGSTVIGPGAITTEKLAVGAITAQSGVVASLDAGAIIVGTLDAARLAANSITADKVLIGSDRNLIPNGDLSAGNASGWPSNRFTYQTSNTPPEYNAAVNIDGTTSIRINDSKFAVQPGDSVVYEMWIKADKPDSRVVQEVRDQDGAHVRRSGYDWTTLSGGTQSSVSYPMYFTVPTTWIKVVSRITIPPGVTSIYLGALFPNHSSGSERTATLSLSGLKLYKAVGSTLIGPGVITTEKLAVGAITAQSGVVGSLDAGTITVGTLAAARLAALSITADKVLLGGDRNMIPNGDLTAGSAANWPSNATYQTTDKPDALPAAVTFPAGAGYNYDFANMGLWPVTPGETVVFEIWVKADKANSRLVIPIHNQNGSGSSTANRVAGWSDIEGGASSTSGPVWTGYVVPTTWTRLRSKVVIPSGVTGIKIQGFYLNYSTGTERNAALSAAGMKLYKQVGSTLIEAGSITTEKLAVGAITAESGVIASLDASKITVGTLSGARLAADAINGMQIIGAQIATSTTFPRVQLDTAGLAVYSSSSVRTFFADASNGKLTVVGDFSTGTSGARVEISSAPTGMGQWAGGESGIVVRRSSVGKVGVTIKSREESGTYGFSDDIIDLGGKITLSYSTTAIGSVTGKIESTVGYSSSPFIGPRGLVISDTGRVGINAPKLVDLVSNNTSLLVDGVANTITSTAIVNRSTTVVVEPTSPFSNYSTSETDKFKAIKTNGVVHFTGTANCGTDAPINTGSGGKFCTLPVGYRPMPGTNFNALMQGSGSNKWVLIINDSGECFAARYGTSSYVSPSSNTWLPFTASFPADTP